MPDKTKNQTKKQRDGKFRPQLSKSIFHLFSLNVCMIIYLGHIFDVLILYKCLSFDSPTTCDRIEGGGKEKNRKSFFNNILRLI